VTLLHNVEVDGAVVDVRLDGDRIAAIDPPAGSDLVDSIDGGGGALVPGLHDHHIHLLATAAARTSIDVSAGLAALATAPGGSGWLRAIGSLVDDLDAARIDEYVADRPVRVQHHSGAVWSLNTAAMATLGVDPATSGRLWRADGWLRDQLADDGNLDLVRLGVELASYGITGVTDATPDLDAPAVAMLHDALPQLIVALGDRKLIIGDHELPAYDELRIAVGTVHESGRPAAVHCVTREALALLVAVLDDVGSLPGDRVEHAAVADDVLAGRLAQLGIAVVTQPGFVQARGDRYLADVEPADQCDLYRYAGLQAAGVTVVPSSDAPYGPIDPWVVIRSARDRLTASGAALGSAESVSTATALEGYLKAPDDLAGLPRVVAVGAAADLVLLDCSLAEMLADPSAGHVVATWIAGRLEFQR
jgi:predicted amidohydrolase YtcJ